MTCRFAAFASIALLLAVYGVRGVSRGCRKHLLSIVDVDGVISAQQCLVQSVVTTMIMTMMMVPCGFYSLRLEQPARILFLVSLGHLNHYFIIVIIYFLLLLFLLLLFIFYYYFFYYYYLFFIIYYLYYFQNNFIILKNYSHVFSWKLSKVLKRSRQLKSQNKWHIWIIRFSWLSQASKLAKININSLWNWLWNEKLLDPMWIIKIADVFWKNKIDYYINYTLYKSLECSWEINLMH